MPLIVEDGTGMATAEAYLSVADWRLYGDDWGLSHAGVTDATAEQRLRRAAAYIDTIARYKGQRAVPTQAMEFPRIGLTDWSGYDVTGVPARVKKAQAELAYKALSEDLYADLDRGGKVTSESVGPISVSYAPDAPAGKLFQFAMQLLEPYVHKGGDDITGPFFSTSEAPLFGIGMMDYPGEPGTEG